MSWDCYVIPEAAVGSKVGRILLQNLPLCSDMFWPYEIKKSKLLTCINSISYHYFQLKRHKSLAVLFNSMNEIIVQKRKLP